MPRIQYEPNRKRGRARADQPFGYSSIYGVRKRAPAGYGVTHEPGSTRGAKGAQKLKPVQPAGDPPPTFPGTRPEWALYWAALQRGMQPNLDFEYQGHTQGVETSYYSTVDFLFRNYHIGVEIQGHFWHGTTAARANDAMRIAGMAAQGIKVIPVDEDMALQDPSFYLAEALKGISHSLITSSRG